MESGAVELAITWVSAGCFVSVKSCWSFVRFTSLVSPLGDEGQVRFDVGLGCRLAQMERLDFVDHDIRRLRSDALVEAGFHMVPLPLEETQLGALVAGKEFLHVEREVRLRRECHAEGLDLAVVVRLHLIKRVRY